MPIFYTYHIFTCYPSQVIKKLPSSLKVVDLSADFRLKNVETYKEW